MDRQALLHGLINVRLNMNDKEDQEAKNLLTSIINGFRPIHKAGKEVFFFNEKKPDSYRKIKIIANGAIFTTTTYEYKGMLMVVNRDPDRDVFGYNPDLLGAHALWQYT